MKVECRALYEERQDVTVTSYILDDSKEMLNGESRGGIIICPGGGYFNCSDREAEPVAMAFSAMGYHTFIVRYSVYTQGKKEFPDLSKPLEIKKETIHPQPVIDLARAVLYVKSRKEEWNLDIDKIAICGFSAGGHNCAMYSVYWDKPLLLDALGVEKEELRIAACILGYPLTDYVYLNQYLETSANKLDRMFFYASNQIFLGVAAKELTEEILTKVSPARLVDKNCPPMFIWGTAGDGLVPSVHSSLMAAALAKANVPFEIHIFEEGDHGLSLADWVTAAAMDQINPDAAQWVELVKKWLKKRFIPVLPAQSNFEDLIPEETKMQID